MTTFRLLRQTNRSSRFAQVTVEVAASSRPEVEVTATAADEHRAGSRAGRSVGSARPPHGGEGDRDRHGHHEIDTSVGDVYGATAHAVWQALRVEHRVPYVGFSDPEMVASWLTSMFGRRLDAVTEARHWHEGRRESDAESLLHAWLFSEYAVPVGLHGHGHMNEYGESRVGPAQSPDVLHDGGCDPRHLPVARGAAITCSCCCGKSPTPIGSSTRSPPEPPGVGRLGLS